MTIIVSHQDLICAYTISVVLVIIIICLSIYVIRSLSILYKGEQTNRYFVYLTTLTTMSNILSSLFLSSFIYSEYNDPYNWFVHGPCWYCHPSFILRLIGSSLWTLSKVGLFTLFNGRLYFGFESSIYEISKKRFVIMNYITLMMALSIFLGYFSLIIGLDMIYMIIGFQTFRIYWVIISIIYVILFNKRLLMITMQYPIIMNIKPMTELSDTGIPSLPSINSVHSNSIPSKSTPNSTENTKADFDKDKIGKKTGRNRNVDERNKIKIFLEMAIKSTIIVGILCFGPIMVDTIWFFEAYGYISILIPINLMILNILIDSICIILFFKFGNNLYLYLCKCNNYKYRLYCRCGCHFCCEHLCKTLSKRF